MKNRVFTIMLGILIGTVLAGRSIAQDVRIAAARSNQRICVDGRQVDLEAYAINGSNYVKLRDVGQAVGFNVYWDGSSVQIDSSAAYTGAAPAPAQNTGPVQSVSAPQVPVALTSANVNASSRDVEALRQEIIDRTNAVRAEHGLPALRADPMLMKAAQVRADEMAATTTYSHTRPDGSFCKTVTDCPNISENIHRIICDFIEVRGINVAEFAVRGWTCSDGHLRNILQDGMSGIGVGLAIGVNDFGEESWYCVQQFIRNGCTITWVDTPKIP